MNLYNTNMHISVFVFIVSQILILFYLCIHYLYQPNDKNRLYLIVLLLLVLAYNLIGGTFPDRRIPISLSNQNKIEYGSGFLMCCFVPYYFFKVYKLDSMRWHITYGVLFCFVLPYVICFLIVYPLLPNWEIIRKIGVIIPFIYSLVFVYQLGAAIYQKHKAKKLSDQREIIWIFLAVAPWVSLSLTSYFAAPDYVEYPLTNTGFLVVLFLFIRNHIHAQRAQDLSLTSVNVQLSALNEQLSLANQKLATLNIELEHKVTERTKELQELSEKKMNTFSNLAHEMKTPLTLLKDYMHGLALQYPDSEPVHFAKKHIGKLSRDVVNLFDLLRSEKGIHQYDHNCTSNLSMVVTERMMFFERSAKERNITITHQIEPDLAVRANQTALERVVNNLIDNAIKYSPNNSTIHISLQAHGEDRLTFSITDQGMGIEAGFLDLIFEPYARISHTHSHGMGMGLPIVKTILDQIGGIIRVSSDPDRRQGSEFIIDLPYEKQVSDFFTLFKLGHEPILDPQPPTHSQLLSDEYAPASYVSFKPHEFIHDKEKKTILVVEDNVEMLQMLTDYLTPLYNTYYAFDGVKAMERLKTMPEPDLILSDVMMPVMDGFSFRRKLIGTDAKYFAIPFVFLSARSEDKMKGLHLKADFIDKPFDIQQVLAKINTHIAFRESNIEHTRSKMIESVFHYSQQHFSQQQLGSEQSKSKQTSSGQNNSEKELSDIQSQQTLNLYPEQDLQQSFFRKLTRMASDNVITSREKEILLLFLDRLTNSQIADRCGISEYTIKKHIQNIFQSLNVSTKEQAIEYVLSYRID